MLDILTEQQFQEWYMYFNLEPWGFVELDAQHSLDRYVTMLSAGLKDKGGNKLSPETTSRLAFLNKKIEDVRLGEKVIKERNAMAIKNLFLGMAKKNKKPFKKVGK